MYPFRRRVVWLLSGLAVVAVLALGLWLSPRMGSPPQSQSDRSHVGQSQTSPLVTPTSGVADARPREDGTPQQRLGGEPENPQLVRGTLQSVRVGELDRCDNLAVAPIFGSGSGGGRSVLGLAEAMQQKAVLIEELPSKQVPTVRVRLTQDVPVLCQSGDVITGGDQDRCIKRDVLLTQKGETRDIPVYCVEPGRWHGNGRFDAFYCPANNLTQGWVKSTLLEAAGTEADGQNWAWGKVRSNLRGVAAGGASETIASVETSSDVSKARQRYREHFAKFLEEHRDAIGVAFIAGDKILGIEVFADHRGFAVKWSMLLDAAVVDALQVSDADKAPSRAELQAFLDSAARSNFRRHVPIGAGEEYSVATDKAVGSLLFEEGRLLHARVVPQDEVTLKHETARTGAAAAPAPRLVY